MQPQNLISSYRPISLLGDFNFSAVDNNTVNEYMDALRDDAAAGFDGIGVKFLERYKPYSIDCLTRLINTCIFSANFDNILKYAKV